MTITVEIKINKKLIAGAIITKVSRSPDLRRELPNGETYDVLVVEKDEPHYGIKHTGNEFRISGHDSFQTVWALVQKVATEAEARING